MPTKKQPGVVLLDSGVDPHPDLTDCVRVFIDFLHQRKKPYDDYGHGTHIAGIIAGTGKMSNGKRKGYSPGCPLYVLKILDEHGEGRREYVRRALDWIQMHKEQYNLRILNFSLGSGPGDTANQQKILEMVDPMVEQGMIVIAAAGNLGPGRGSVTAPGSSKKVITVGASDMLKYTMVYSGRGPTKECVCKPDVVFPGSNIVSCCARCENRGLYCTKSGTSMSSAAVAGLTAELLKRYPKATHREIKNSMRYCCSTLHMDQNAQGWGKLEPALFLERNPSL